MSNIWKLGGGRKDGRSSTVSSAVPTSSAFSFSSSSSSSTATAVSSSTSSVGTKKKADKKTKKDTKRKNKSPHDDFVLSGPTNAQHLGHMGFDRKNGFEVRNLPPEWEALFKGLNETLKSLGAHGVTKKEAQMLFAMASDALVPGAAAAPSITAQSKPILDKDDKKKTNSTTTEAVKVSGGFDAVDYAQLYKEKDALVKEKQNWIKEREALLKEKEELLKERESLNKSKENTARLHDENIKLFQQFQDERKSRVQYENENTQLGQRLRILEYELGQVKTQLSSTSSTTESSNKRHDAEILELMAKHEAVVLRKEQELTYERDYRSQLQVEKMELENQIAQIRAEILSLQAQGVNPSTALAEAKRIFDMELDGVMKRLEDDMRQTKQLLAYEQQCRVFYEDASRKHEAEALQLKAQLEEYQANEKAWNVEKARLLKELESQQTKVAEETGKLLNKLNESTERLLALEQESRKDHDRFEKELREKEEQYEAIIKQKNEQLSELKVQLEATKAQAAVPSPPVVPPVAPAAPPPAPPPGPPPPGPAPTRAVGATPARSSAPDTFEAGSRDALLAAIKNPVLLNHVEPGKKEDKRDPAAEDGNVLNIIARALLARRAVIKTDEEAEEEDLWE